MLVLKDEYDVIHNFMLLDAHTHLKINKLEGLVPSEFVRKFSSIVKDVAIDIKKNEKDYRFRFPWDLTDRPTDYYDYCQKDAYSIVHPGEDLRGVLDKYMGFDFIITFSANLTSSLPRDYRSANSKIREALIEKSPDDNAPHNNFRFIGFGRLDPNHSDALDAFDNAFQLGLRGLKLHPKEENFEIVGERMEEILTKAAHYNIPVIFHTQEGMAERVKEVVDNTIKSLVDTDKIQMVPRLKVILGHAPWNGVGNNGLYKILSHPNIFGEISTLRPESFAEFFSNSKSQIKYEGILESNNIFEQDWEKVEESYFRYYGYNNFNYWSSKLLFGSDTPYPPSHSVPQLIKHLFSKEFVGNATDIKNILGISALRLIPPIAKSNIQEEKEQASTSLKHHPTQLTQLKKDSKALGMDPLIDVFPCARISGAVFSFLKEGRTESWLFRSLFSPNKPMNMVIPNPHDLSDSSILTATSTLTQCIEMSLQED
ncbi:MAG: amidohydrolase family protein [Methanomassiliicoccales archaeon]|nr:MAG: amidohydrolase family protein [Methanomassiliicoccales archaeon]